MGMPCGLFDLIDAEILFYLSFKSQSASHPLDIFGIGAGLRRGVEKLYKLLFIQIFTPVAQHGLKGRCPARVLSALAGFLKETESFHAGGLMVVKGLISA